MLASTVLLGASLELFRKDENVSPVPKRHKCACLLKTSEESMARLIGSQNKQFDSIGALGALQGSETPRPTGAKLTLTSTSHLMCAPFCLHWHLPTCIGETHAQCDTNCFIFYVCALFSRLFVEEVHLRLSTGKSKYVNSSVCECKLSF